MNLRLGHPGLAYFILPAQMTTLRKKAASGFKVESISAGSNKQKATKTVVVAKNKNTKKRQVAPKEPLSKKATCIQESEDDLESEDGEEALSEENMIENFEDEFSEEDEEVQKDWLESASEGEQDEFSEIEDDDDSEVELGNDISEDEEDEEQVQMGMKKLEERKLIINTAEEVEEASPEGIPNLSLINSRIQATIAVLSNWKSHSIQATKPRSEFVAQLKTDLSVYFGYSEFLMEKFMDLFPKPTELHAFLEANEMQRPVTIRCNTLKCRRKELAQALIARGVNLEPTMERWNPVGLQIFDSKVPIGATPEYLAGHYMLQAAASFLPVLAMGIVPNGNERILDMCAAPGGKTTFIAAQMRNTGFLFANDVSADRIKSLAANVHRMGVQNCVITCMDGRKYGNYMKGFDRILLDAPCSGSGVISKDTSVKTSKNAEDLQALSHLQKELILSAIDALECSKDKPGVLVYSTCSILVEENEEVVDYALRKRPNVQLMDTGLEFGEEGFVSIKDKQFNKSLKLTRRYYPHTHNLDGFYVAKLIKTAPASNEKVKPEH